MPEIYYKAENYIGDYAHINQVNETAINCTKLDLCRSIITVGTPSFITLENIKQHGFIRTVYNSIIEKAGYVSNLHIENNIIKRHPIYDDFVSDKKRIVSYNLGMAFAKFYSQKLFDIPDLIHVETLKKNNSIEFNYDDDTLKKREPDLVGSSEIDKWHIFEAKGMTSNQLNSKIVSAKEQVQMVTSIHDCVPETLNACATYIDTRKIITILSDPKSLQKKIIKLKKEKFTKSYYSLSEYFKRYSKEHLKESIDGLKVVTFPLKAKGISLRVSIEEELFENIQDENYDSIYESRKKMLNYREVSEPDISIGIDGYIIRNSH